VGLRRIASLVVAMVIALLPGALNACEARCASHGPAAAAASAHHHHSHTGPSADAHHAMHHPGAASAQPPMLPVPTLRAVPHDCLHGDGLPEFLGGGDHATLVPPAALPFDFNPGPALSRSPRRAESPPSPASTRLVLTTQLRV
jgi:hypothetical protein